MARRPPPERGLRRRKAEKLPKRKIVIICEGEKTEPDYLRQYIAELIYPPELLKVEIIEKGGTPGTIVETAKQHKKDLESIARKSSDRFQGDFEIWGVFDVDEHPKLNVAKSEAANNKIQLAISNPCIELWALFHFQDQDAPIHRHVAQKKLAELMPKYKKSGAKQFDFQQMSANYSDAKKRAEGSLANREQENNPGGNPSTNLHKLLEIIKNQSRP